MLKFGKKSIAKRLNHSLHKAIFQFQHISILFKISQSQFMCWVYCDIHTTCNVYVWFMERYRWCRIYVSQLTYPRMKGGLLCVSVCTVFILQKERCWFSVMTVGLDTVLWFKSCGRWHCVTGPVVSNALKNHGTFKTLGAYPLCSVTFYKRWIFSYTAVKTKNY